MKIPASLCHLLPQGVLPKEVLKLLAPSLPVMITLFEQLAVNKDKVQAVMVLDGGVQESMIALGLLSKLAIKHLVVTSDSYEQ